MGTRRRRPACLLVGATGTLGPAIARRLGSEGFDLALVFRRRLAEARRLAASLRRLGSGVVLASADCETPSGAAAAVRASRRAFGRLDALVVALGELRTGSIGDLSPGAMRSLLSSNLESALLLARAALPSLRRSRRGRIVFLGQAGAGELRARTRTAGYAAAKAGLLVLARSLARAEAPRGVTVNVVSPGSIEGSRGEGAPLRAIPAGRRGRPEEVAAAVAFFLSDEAAYVAGADLPVSGGFGI